MNIPIRNRIFYGWFALAGVMLVIFVVGGSFVTSFGVFLPVICSEFGWSRAAVAATLSLGVLAFGLPSPLFGILVVRFGPRFTIITGNLLAALGLACMSIVHEVWHLYILYIIIGLGAGFGGYIASTTVINNWFIKKRSMALGMFIACSGMGGFVLPPFVTALISAIGWRTTWLVLGGIVALVAVLIGGLLLVRNRPEDIGLLPDGISSGAFSREETTGYSTGEEDTKRGHTRHALLSISTWLIGAFAAANAFAQGTMLTHQVAYLQDLGFSAMTAATTLSSMALFNTIGCLVFGTLALRYGVRHLAITAFFFQLTALTILLTTKELTLIYIYSALMGLSNGALLTAMPTFIGAYYGRERYARVLGVVFPFQVVSQAVAATAAGAVYDATASYGTSFIIVTVISLMGLFSVYRARPPK